MKSEYELPSSIEYPEALIYPLEAVKNPELLKEAMEESKKAEEKLKVLLETLKTVPFVKIEGKLYDGKKLMVDLNKNAGIFVFVPSLPFEANDSLERDDLIFCIETHLKIMRFIRGSFRRALKELEGIDLEAVFKPDKSVDMDLLPQTLRALWKAGAISIRVRMSERKKIYYNYEDKKKIILNFEVPANSRELYETDVFELAKIPETSTIIDNEPLPLFQLCLFTKKRIPREEAEKAMKTFMKLVNKSVQSNNVYLYSATPCLCFSEVQIICMNFLPHEPPQRLYFFLEFLPDKISISSLIKEFVREVTFS